MGNFLFTSSTTTTTVENRVLSFDDQMAAGFYSDEGWGAEPITKELQVPGDVIGQIFPHQQDNISFTAFFGGKPIGHCSANMWIDFLEKIPGNLNVQNSNVLASDGTKKFVQLLKAVVLVEETQLKDFFVLKGIDINKVSHNCGLMVLSEHKGKGVGTQLVAESDKVLSQEFSANVVETTNAASRRAFEKNGYVEFKSFVLTLFSIPIEDKYSIMYKIY